MNQSSTRLAPTGLLSESALPITPEVQHRSPSEIDPAFQAIVDNYDLSAGTVYGQSREAELTDVERALIRPAGAVGTLAVGRYSVGPEQSEAAQARIAEHEAWIHSDARRLALGEMLAMQAIVEAQAHDQMQREAARWMAELLGDDEDDEEDKEDEENIDSGKPRSNFR